MFQAQYLFKGNAVYSPWMPRKGDNVIVTAELVAKNAGALEVKLWHKNSDEPGEGAQVGATVITLNGTPPERKEEVFSDLKELVRYRFECTGTSATEFVLFRMLAPVWFDDVAA